MTKKVTLTPEILLSFSDVYLKKNFDDPAPTPTAHLEWWAYCCMMVAYVAIAAPRGHAKSTAITFTYVLASVCFRIKRHVLLISDTEGQAIMFLGNISRELRENHDLQRTFGFKRIVKDNENELIIEWLDGKQTRIAAHGSGQKIRGTNWHGVRPDLIVCDDLENDEMVMNEERRLKFRNWFDNTLLPIGGKYAEIRVVGTILHEDSMLANLMPDLLGDPLCVNEPLRLRTTKESAFTSVLYRAHPDFDDFSELLWPEYWSEERLKLRRQVYLDNGHPEGYAQEYLNNPMASEGAYFDQDDLIPIELDQMVKESKHPETYFIGVDLAISEKARRAFTVFCVVGYDHTRTLRVREIFRKRMDSLSIIETFFHLHLKYRAKSPNREEPVFLVEKENISKAIGPILNKEMEERDEYIHIELMPPIRDKEMRGRSLQARVRAHRVEFDHEATWWPHLVHEMITFPRSTYTDQVDALAWVGHYVANMHEPPSYAELEEEQWEDDYEEAGFSYGGASPITGY